MKKNYLIIAFWLISLTSIKSFGFQLQPKLDTNEVIRLYNKAFSARLDDPAKTENLAESAIQLALKLDYKNGLAEAYRIKGVGLSYQRKYVEAYDSYVDALKIFEDLDNKSGEAKINNNIGNLYRDENYDKALSFYTKALPVFLMLKDSTMIAGVSLNMANVYFRQKKFDEALTGFLKAQEIFEKRKFKNPVNDIICTQNIGVIYKNLNQFDKAEALLLKANAGAKENNMKLNVASIGITLAEIYIAKNNFTEAERYINEGLAYAQNTKFEKDYRYTSYQLELKRKNYEKALSILAKIYSGDSTNYKNFVSQQIDLAEKELKNQQQEITIANQKKTEYLFWGIGVGAVLLLIVVVLLIANVRRKAETNKQLTELNAEVSRQKENVDRINRHLEEIIDERTKDLQIKNKKLAEHSSYLSHQIRGPIATLKGLMNLEKEGLVDKQECINMMNKCVSEIDDKIIDMSDMLHNPGRTGL